MKMRARVVSVFVVGAIVVVAVPLATAPVHAGRHTSAPPSTTAPGQAALPLCPTPPPPPDPAAPTTTPDMNLPAWGAGSWGASQSYRTIQTADLDGDGDAELIGRSSAGIEAWDFSTLYGRWTPLYVGTRLGWTDAEGWDRKEYYETIQAADIDGEPGEELIARYEDGLIFYRLPAGATDWEEALRPLTEFSDKYDWWWSLPSHYQTIQTADLDGDGVDEIFGRTPTGIEIADWSDGAWHLSSFAGFGDADGWNLVDAFWQSIQAADLDGDGRAEIFGLGNFGLEVWGLPEGTLAAGTWQQEVSDGPLEGWEDADNLLTLQAADLDGKGGDEVFIRGDHGIRIWGYAYKAKGTFSEWSDNLAEFTDIQGWYKPEYYQTIQAADLDGDGRAEIFGRWHGGLTVWGYDSNQWVPAQKVVGPPWSDALGWNDPSSYSTIQTADVDGITLKGSPGANGASRAEVLGRGPNGIQTYRWDAKTGSWSTTSAPFPRYTGASLTAYQYLSLYLTDDQSCDVRSQYADYLGTEEYAPFSSWTPPDNGTGGKLSSVTPTIDPPRGVTPKTFSVMWSALRTESIWGQAVVSNGLRLFDAMQSEAITDMLDTTCDYLKYKKDDAHELVADLFVLVGGVADALANLGEPGLQATFGVVDALLSAGQNLASNVYRGPYLALKNDQIGKWLKSGEAAQVAATVEMLSDYGLLATVGDLYTSTDPDRHWLVPKPDTPLYLKKQAAHQRAYSIFIWQSVMQPLHWRLKTCTTDCPAYPSTPLLHTWALRKRDTHIPDSLIRQLFRPTSTACQTDFLLYTNTDGENVPVCDLGVSLPDVYLGLAGWDIECGAFPDDLCQELYTEAEEYGQRSASQMP